MKNNERKPRSNLKKYSRKKKKKTVENIRFNSNKVRARINPLAIVKVVPIRLYLTYI